MKEKMGVMGFEPTTTRLRIEKIVLSVSRSGQPFFVLYPFELHPHEGNKSMTSFGVEPKIKGINFHLHAGHLLYEVTKKCRTLYMVFSDSELCIVLL